VHGEAPKAFVVLRPGASVTADEIKEFCRKHIAAYKAPSEIEFRESLPHGPTGKVLKQRLVTQALPGRKKA
jgi:long-chain acyl-CoA synthetase